MALGPATALPVQPANEGAPLHSELSAMTQPRVLYTPAVACVGFAGTFSVFGYAMPTLPHQADRPEAQGPLVLTTFGGGSVIGNLIGGRLPLAAIAPVGLAVAGESWRVLSKRVKSQISTTWQCLDLCLTSLARVVASPRI